MKNNNNNKLNNGVKIVNVEGKDIKRGFSFNDKNGELATYKFKGNFDFSLGLIELERICGEKGIQLYEEINGKLYSNVLMCLTFEYSNKSNSCELENVNNNKSLVKGQYKANKKQTEVISKENAKKLIKELMEERDSKLKGSKDAEEIASVKSLYREKIAQIRLNRDNTISINKQEVKQELKQQINQLNQELEELNSLLSRNGVRQDLYENNFVVDGKTYRRFARSSGSARVGKCLMILEDLYEEMMEYALAGNEVIEDMEIDLPSYEAYLGLVNTALEDIMYINPENILLVEDVYSAPFPEECMVTKLVDGKLTTDKEVVEVSSNLFDGASLVDFSLLEEEYAYSGGVQLRNKWFKGFATGCNMQQFFEEHKITDISQLNGWTIAEDIKDVKFITTKSSVKYLKVNKGYEGFIKWLNIISPVWGICGHPHHSKFVGGEYVQAHYQLLNNIQLSPSQVAEVAAESKQYANLLKNDLEVFKMHIKAEMETEKHITNDEEKVVDDFDTIQMNDNAKFISTMLQLNDDFAKTKVFKDFRDDVVDKFLENCKRGHVLIYGCYAVVIMNSIDYLYHAIDANWEATKEKSHMAHESIMCEYFGYNQELLCSRSPMPVQGNVMLTKNVENSQIRTYFSYNGKMSKFIMHINAIESNCCERGSGYDADGDKFLITNQKTLLSQAKKNYNKFLVPVNKVESDEPIKYHWNNKDKAKLDIKCSQNNIGRIINDSMILVSEYWHRINSGETHENLLPLYKYISELSIMSNLAIDACKRPVPYDEELELTRIENCTYFRDREVIQVKVKDSYVNKKGIKHNKTYKGHDGKKKQAYQKDENKNYIKKDKNAKVRPYFFKLVGQGKEYCFQEFNCSMDFLQKVMKVKLTTTNRCKNIDLSDLFSDYANQLKTGKAQKRDIDKIVGTEEIEGIIEILDSKIKAINLDKKKSSEDRKEEITSARNEAVENLQGMVKGKGITDETMIAILKRLDRDYKAKSGGLSSVGRILLSSLFEAYQDQFVRMFKNTVKEVQQLVEDRDGNIRIFNKNYKKIKVSKFFNNEEAV